MGQFDAERGAPVDHRGVDVWDDHAHRHVSAQEPQCRVTEARVGALLVDEGHLHEETTFIRSFSVQDQEPKIKIRLF